MSLAMHRAVVRTLLKSGRLGTRQKFRFVKAWRSLRSGIERTPSSPQLQRGAERNDMAVVDTAPTAAGTGSSVVVERCQICEYAPLERILFLGYLPPVNQMRTIDALPKEQPA